MNGRLLAAVGIVLFAVLGSGHACAEPWVTKTTCDSTRIQGVVYPRVSLEARNQDSYYSVDFINARRLPSSPPEDTCRVVSAIAPPGWVSFVEEEGTLVLWQRVEDDAPTFLAGETLEGLQLVFSGERGGCFEFHFVGLYPEPVAVENDCFSCDRPVPVVGRTWGAVKALYR